MSKHWVKKLADEIKERDESAATDVLRQERRDRVLKEKSESFYDEMVKAIQQDVIEFTSELKGTSLESPIVVKSLGQRHHIIKRLRFPFVEATLNYSESKIAVSGMVSPTQQGAGARSLSIIFTFHLGEMDGFSVRETFGANPKHWEQPDEAAKHILELILSPEPIPQAG